MASVDLGQLGAPLPSTTLQLSPRSFTMATQQVLSSISPAKRPAPTFALPPKKICFDVSNAPGPSTIPDRPEIRPLVFSPRGKVEWRRLIALGLPASWICLQLDGKRLRSCHNPLPYVVGQREIVFMHYVRIILSLPCPRMTCYYIISAKCG